MDYLERVAARSRILRAMRRFFEARGFTEVDTPIALTAPAPEPYIEAPATELKTGTRRYLQTSPELPMKRLLARGFERIFQLAPVFRFGDHTRIHRPEFRLLEWYRRGAPWTSVLEDCEGLLIECADAAGTLRVSGPFERITVDEAFREYAGFSILEHLAPSELAARVRGAQAGDSWNDLFHRVFLEQVEPRLMAQPRPLFLTHYPAPLASLARLSPEDPRVSERFELYFGGMELANGFGELVDPDVQRQRFERDRVERVQNGFADYPFDERFFAALATLPPSAGIALGFDRLVLALVGGSDLDDAAFLPWSET